MASTFQKLFTRLHKLLKAVFTRIIVKYNYIDFLTVQISQKLDHKEFVVVKSKRMELRTNEFQSVLVNLWKQNHCPNLPQRKMHGGTLETKYEDGNKTANKWKEFLFKIHTENDDKVLPKTRENRNSQNFKRSCSCNHEILLNSSFFMWKKVQLAVLA